MNLTIVKLYFFKPYKIFRFQDILQMDFPKWLLHPFGYEISSLPTDQRAEFIEIMHDEEMSNYSERQGYL